MPALPETPEVTLLSTRAEVAPVIDGKLDDPCWGTAVSASGFRIYGTAQTASQQTRVLLTYDASHLYLAYVCQESDMSGIIANPRAELREGENDSVWKNDCIELFLDPHLTREDCHQFEVDALAQKWDAHITTELRRTPDGLFPHVIEHPLWDSGFRAAARKDADAWTVELAVPAASMGIERILDGSVWGINFTRNEHPAEESSTWMPWEHKGNFGNSRYFGRLVLGKGSCRLGEVTLGARAPGRNRLRARLLNTSRRRLNLNLALDIASPSGETRTFSRKIKLRPGEEVETHLEYDIPQTKGEIKLALSVTDAGRGTLLARRRHTFRPAVPTLEFKLSNKTAYRTDKKVNAELTVNVGDVTREKSRIEIDILRGEESVKHAVRSGAVGSGNTIKLDVAGLAEGRYRIRVRLADGHGALLAVAQENLSIIADPFDW